MRVLVTGATGFIGKVVVRHLLEAGDEVVVLTRNVAKAALVLGNKCKYVKWSDTSVAPSREAFEGVDGVINLMGENIAGHRWTPEQKKVIYDSRIDGTLRLIETMATLEKRPKVFVSASAVGIYGDRGDEELNEQSSASDDFLAHLCKDWEATANRAKDLGCRVVIIRTGMVIGKGGGALAKMLPVFKKGLGGPLGSGKHYMSWIHVEDLAALYLGCLKNESAQGVYNGTAPYPATNQDFTHSLSRALKRPAFLRVPPFVIRKAFGEMSTVLLGGQRVLPVRGKEINFRYRYPTLDMALKETVH